MIYFFVGLLHFFLGAVIVENYQKKTGFLPDVFFEKLGIFVIIEKALRDDVATNATPDHWRYWINTKLLIYLHSSLQTAKM